MNPVSSNQNTLQSTASTATASKESSASSIKVQKKPSGEAMRSALNGQIIEASLKVSITAGDKSQSLMLRSVLDKINEAIGPEFKSQIMPDYKAPMASAIDSPEKAAETILSFSLGLFARYSEQHATKDSEQMATDFVKLVRGGFEKGFNEAVDILKGLGVFEGNIAEEIGKTWELVQKGYDDFITAHVTAKE